MAETVEKHTSDMLEKTRELQRRNDEYRASLAHIQQQHDYEFKTQFDSHMREMQEQNKKSKDMQEKHAKDILDMCRKFNELKDKHMQDLEDTNQRHRTLVRELHAKHD